MSIDSNNTSFWDDRADYRKLANAFTSPYAERAWREAALPANAKVLDIAAGAGALTFVAARAGAQVLATDFSSGMVEGVLSVGLPNVEACIMDGQALDLPDASFDAAFSMFGIVLFPDWRKGLSEMARVVRLGGLGAIGLWKEPAGAGSNLLLAQRTLNLVPRAKIPKPTRGMEELSNPDRLRAAMTAAGFADVSIVEETTDFILDQTLFADPARLFQFSPIWPELEDESRKDVLTSIGSDLAARGGVLPVPSSALIATGHRV